MAQAIARISAQALRENYLKIREVVSPAKISAVVKDNAYGHGLDLVAGVLGDMADGFCVATVEEGVSLRNLNVTQPIWVLTGFHSNDELQETIRFRLTPVVHSDYQVKLIERQNHTGLTVVVEVDTGMGRLGFRQEELTNSISVLEKRSTISAVMSHFAMADDLGSAATTEQMISFANATKNFSYQRSIANSAGLLGWPGSHYEWVRPGLALYGVSPFSSGGHLKNELRPVMTLEGHVISIREMRKGETIGYGKDWICPEKMFVAVVACGYGDGVPRISPGNGKVWIDGHFANILGRVSMDSLVIDLRGLRPISVGHRVEIWGVNRRVEDVAVDAGTIPNDLLTRVSARVLRENS